MQEDTKGMGTTVAIVVVDGDDAFFSPTKSTVSLSIPVHLIFRPAIWKELKIM